MARGHLGCLLHGRSDGEARPVIQQLVLQSVLQPVLQPVLRQALSCAGRCVLGAAIPGSRYSRRVRFTKPFWAGIADGSITVAFRYWKQPTVVAGRPYRTGGGRIEVDSVEVVDPSAITAVDVANSGHGSRQELDAYLESAGTDPDRRLHCIRFHRLDEPDPRELLADDDSLSADDVAAISTRLDRFDKAAPAGPWTRTTLELIAHHPARRAPDLAVMAGRETKAFKLDVRKLKNLGLTRSLRIGYELSPRGQAYLDRPDSSGGTTAGER